LTVAQRGRNLVVLGNVPTNCVLCVVRFTTYKLKLLA
jgi:hypothetical protein